VGLLSELERRAMIKLVNNAEDCVAVCDGNDKRVLVSPDVIKRTVEFDVVGPSTHR
jgi:hypothetical protein